MSDNRERKQKKKKKKSFLYNIMCRLTNRKRSKHRQEGSSSESDEYEAISRHASSSRAPVRPKRPSKQTTSVMKKVNTSAATAVPASADLSANTGQQHMLNDLTKFEHPDNVIHLSGDKVKHNNDESSGFHSVRLTSVNDTPTRARDGSDRNIELKRAFAQYVNSNEPRMASTEVQSIQGYQPIVQDSSHAGQPDKFPKYVIISKQQVIDSIAPCGLEMKATKQLLIKEKKNSKDDVSSDSDESDTTESMHSDSQDSTDDEPNIAELYFTTGKFITYFFLEMERQYYNPEAEKYSYIHYHDSSVERTKKGELSSSDSASPNICHHGKQKLLHRRSVDNLVVTSAPTSIEHSSPESIKSAPIRLKPRSTSHDAITRKKERYTQGAASMDNLAKQTLLAAHVLNLMPPQKARERNFLHGRIAANSLLGPSELEKVLPNREVKIFIGTWNMNGQTPPKELNDFMLPSEIQTIPDILAIGTQESCSERTEWEAAIQETLGPSHVLLTSASLGTLHLALFLRRDLVWFCSVPEDDSFSTRPGTAFRTKGAVAIAFILFGTSFLFVTAHLTAHQEKVKERVHDIKRIVRNLELPQDLPTKHKSKDVTQNFDCVFWCGDLNFRIAQPREEVIQWITNTRFPTTTAVNLSRDQLRMVLNEGAILRGFEEGPITFPPTYKYDPGTQTFDSSGKQRTPSYTDRILFRGKTQTRGYMRRVSHENAIVYKDGNIECMVYDSVPSICTSDHKPVWGVFKTTVRPGIDTIPLAAGLFNREIYLEGIRRRVATMDGSLGTSKDCSLQ